MTGCRHGMPSPRSCIDCMNDDGVGAEPAPILGVSRTLTAAWPGWCRACGQDIEPGDTIACMTDETYQHEECAT